MPETEIQFDQQLSFPSLKVLSPELVSRATLLALVLGILAVVPGVVALYVSGQTLTLSDLLSQIPRRLFAGSVLVTIGVAVGLVLGFLWPVFAAFTKKLPEFNAQLNQWLAPIIQEKINASQLHDLELDIQSLDDRFTDRLRQLIENLFSDERLQAHANRWINHALEKLRQQFADTIMPRFLEWLKEHHARRVNTQLLEHYLRETVSSSIVDKLSGMIGAWRKRLIIIWIILIFLPVAVLWKPVRHEVGLEQVVPEVNGVTVSPLSGECLRLEPTKKPELSSHLAHANLITMGHPQQLRARLTSAITHSLYHEGLAEYISPACFMKPHPDRRYGLEMGLWHVEYHTLNRHYAHAHFSAQSDFIKAVFTGKVHGEGAVLTLSAAQGMAPEVREQLQLSRYLGQDSLVLFIDDADGGFDLNSLELELKAYLTGLGFDEVQLIRGSTKKILEGDQGALGAEAMQNLLAAIDSSVETPQQSKDKPFLMPVEDVFSITHTGTAATGRIEEGIVSVGDSVEIVGWGGTRSATVTSVEMFRKLLDQGEAGANVAIVFGNLGLKDVKRGHVLAAPGSIILGSHFEAVMYLLATEDGGRTDAISMGYRPQIYIRTSDVTGIVTLPADQAVLQPGEHTLVTVRLTIPMALRKGLRVAVRQGTQTVGVGIITAILKE